MTNQINTDLQFPLGSDNIRLLAEIGLMAATSGHVEIANQLFDGLSFLRPTKPFPYVGKAVALMHVGMLDDAIAELISAVSKVEDDHEQIWIYLGLAYQRRGYLSTARKIFHLLIESGDLSKIDEQLVKSISKNDPLF
ncbi:MAG: hypothetical protein LW714_03680 [Oxalobacteraceae bacterium]|jgi:hypothetical protein|nr:hypothetical protein [Oxalobacteraceae bacterium]